MCSDNRNKVISIINSNADLLTKRKRIQNLKLKQNELRKYLSEIINEENEEVINDILDFVEVFLSTFTKNVLILYGDILKKQLFR